MAPDAIAEQKTIQHHYSISLEERESIIDRLRYLNEQRIDLTTIHSGIDAKGQLVVTVETPAGQIILISTDHG